MARESTTRAVTREQAMAFLDKARQDARGIEDALKRKDWDNAAKNSVLCVISANDALLGTKHGIQPAGQDHRDAAEILVKYEKGEAARKNARRFAKIVNKKNLLMLEGRKSTEAEARSLALLAERFLSWVEEEISSN